MASPKRALQLGPFMKGLNTFSDPSAVPDDGLAELLNMELDLDGSLVSRPPFHDTGIAMPLGASGNLTLLGYFYTPGGAEYLIASDGLSKTYYLSSGTWNLLSGTFAATAMTQFDDKAWLLAPVGSANPGGHWSPGGGFVAEPNMPKGTIIVAFKFRLWVAQGEQATSNGSRLYFSKLLGITPFWPVAPEFIDIARGDGQNIISIHTYYESLLIFRTASIYKFQYGTDPAAGNIEVSVPNVGLDSRWSIAASENYFYFSFDDRAYEYLNGRAQEISQAITFSSTGSRSGFTVPLAVSVFNRRAIFTYYDTLYVFSLLTRTWSRWRAPSRGGIGRVLERRNDGSSPPQAYAMPAVPPGPKTIVTNLFTNPRLVGDGTWAEVYRNLWRTPAMSNLGMVTAQGATLAAVAGGVEVTRTGSPGRASTNAGQRVTITPGTYTITARRQVDAPVGNTGSSDGRLVVVGYDSTGSHRSNAYRRALGTAPTVGVETISEEITPPEWVTSLELSWYSGGTNGDRIIWGDMGVITDAGSYFDGDYSYDPDLTPSWVGAANASQSVLTGVKVAGIADPRAILSTEWDGVPSLRVLGGQIAETFREKMTPFKTSLHPGTISAVDDTATPPWLGAAPVGALWDSGQIAYTSGMPEESLPGMAYVYGCALRTTGGDNPQSIYGSFTVDAPQFAIMVTAWAPTDITVMVNRKPMSVDPVITGSGYQFIVVDGLGAGTHQVDFIVGWGSNLLQVLAPTGSTIAPGAVPSFRLGLTGDSYADSGIAPYFAGLARELWLRTGWSIYQLGQGSTGYTNDGSSSGDLSKSEYGSPSRLAALAAGNVDALLVIGSVNDGSTPPATVKTAVADYLAAVAPIPVLLAGVEPLHLYGVDTSAWDAVNVAVMEAASEAPNVRLAINWRADNWLTGTGSVSQPRGDGNQDIYIGDVAGTDTIHPNYAGQQYLAGRFVTEFTPVSIQGDWMPFAALSGETIVIRARSAGQSVQFGGAEHYPSSGGEIRVSGTGSVDLSEGWWAGIGLFAGDYDGPAFSGSDSGYVWDGAPDASTSSTDTTRMVPLYRITDDTASDFEEFQCVARTKMYAFDTPQLYKRLFWWGLDGIFRMDVRATVTPIVYGGSVTWGELLDKNVTWGQLLFGTWGSPVSETITVETIRHELGSAAQRKFTKFNKKLRFRQLQFQVIFDTKGDDQTAPVRLFSLHAEVTQAQTVAKAIS